MKNVALFLLCVALPMMLSCAGGATPADSRAAFGGNGISFNDVMGKEWMLTEIRSARSTIQINRNTLAANNMRDFFTISFQENRVAGIGAPNRYFGPFTASSGGGLKFGDLASTLMAAFIEPEELKEHEYFAYLGNVTRWNLQEGKLELYSSHSNGVETIMVFTQR